MDALINENPTSTADVTDKPVEKGQDISDHMKLKPVTIALSGFMVKDAASKLETLKRYQKDAELLRFIGRNAYDNMVLTSLSTRHPVDNAEGFDYDITIQNVRLTKPETFEVDVKSPDPEQSPKKMETKVRAKQNKGRVQTKAHSPTSKSTSTTSSPTTSRGYQGENIVKKNLMDSFNRATGKEPERVGPTRAKAAKQFIGNLPSLGV